MSSIGIISSTSLASVDTSLTTAASTVELTDEEKSEIAKVEADYAAKKITESQKDSKIAEIKASSVDTKKEVKNTQQSGSAEKSIDADEKARIEKKKELQELLKSKEAGKTTDTDINDFTEKLKSTLQAGEAALIDKTV